MPDGSNVQARLLDGSKFQDPLITAKGEQRAVVALTHLRTLWFNTGSLCNITCRNCFMESSPKNDDLAYLFLGDVTRYFDEIAREGYGVDEIGFTGGEPFMNKALPSMLEAALERDYRVLVLTNAMKPLWHAREKLLPLKNQYGAALTLRVSTDHYTREKHELERGTDTWEPMLKGLRWLAENNFNVTVAGRTCWDEDEAQSRLKYAELFKDQEIPVDATDPAALVLFPEMDARLDVPEITVHCWDILGVAPESMMCASSRMVVKRRGANSPVVVPCTLLPYVSAFEMGEDLSCSPDTVHLNHPHCARFCVLGGASCSPD
jgi:organic radical activating enzyme